jgi:hypothetical protein
MNFSRPEPEEQWMNVSELRAKVVEEIQNIPEDKLTELLKLIHAFKLRSEPLVSLATPSWTSQVAGTTFLKIPTPNS